MKTDSPPHAHAAGGTLATLAFTHETAPLPVREKLAIPAEEAAGFSAMLRALPGVTGVVFLGTCNRVEIYFSATPESLPVLREAVPAMLAARQALAPGVLAAHCRWLEGQAAIQHLFHVASGLDSQMVGESEILGQVKDAYAAALLRRETGTALNRVFQKSFQAAAWAQSCTAIARGQVSIGNIAVELATRVFGDLSQSRVLVLGLGEVGRKTAQAFVSRGAGGIAIASRDMAKACDIAPSIGGFPVGLSTALHSFGTYDIVIGSAAVPAALVSVDDVRAAATIRAGAPLFLIDLGLPRNFPPGAATLSGVYLYNLDDLSGIANENLRARLAEVNRARAGLAARAARVWQRIHPG
jgi:glutamyl-tRNA reductase